jgi:hypothetical protein
MYCSQTAGIDYAIHFRFWKEDAAKFSLWHRDANYSAALFFLTTEVINSPTGVSTGKSCQKDAWDEVEIRNFNWTAHTLDIYYTAMALCKSGAAMEVGGGSNLVILYDSGSGAGNDTYIDNFRIRQWNATEPAWGTWGALETL